MSIEWICSCNYYDGVHKVKHKLTGEDLFVALEYASLQVDHMYDVVDCKTNKIINFQDYDHLVYYEDGSYFECSDHKGEWLFYDGDEHYDECPKCKSVEDEISNFKVAEDIYQYKSNREFNRLKYLLKTDKYRFWRDGEYDSKPQQGLFILITEYDSDGDEYYYYKTIEKSFMNELEWSEK